MTIVNAVKQDNLGIRVTWSNWEFERWLVFDCNDFNYVVFQRKFRGRKTTESYRGKDEEDAIHFLTRKY